MTRRAGKLKAHRVSDFVDAMESIAPIQLAQDWDNVGLIAGNTTATLRRVLLCIDLTSDVVDEAIHKKAELILSYHPPIFTPVSSLCFPGTGTASLVFRCVRNGIAIYSPHTALDAAAGGPNDILAGLCGAKGIEPLLHVDEPGGRRFKIVVFVPPSEVGKVSEAMFAAGAGRIGDYSHCSYQSPGQGSFFGSEATNPAIGKRGRVEQVEETRLETVVPARALPAVVAAIRASHSYEEPAFDVYALSAIPVAGIGRCGELPRKPSLAALARNLKRKIAVNCVQLVGDAERSVERIIVVVGAAGSLPFDAVRGPGDAIVTGEIRHHDALAIRRLGCTAIALGHWASERPLLAPLASMLVGHLPRVTALVSEADCDPFSSA